MRPNHPWLYMQLLTSTVCCMHGLQEKLLFSTVNKVNEIDLDTGVVTELSTHSAPVHSIAYDATERYVYVPNVDENVIYRFPYPNDQTVNLEIFVYTHKPHYVAFDSGNRHLYWLDLGNIMRCNSDGTDLTTISNVTDPVALALDTHNRWIYYSKHGVHALYRLTFDGNGNQVVSNLLSQPTDIKVDFVDMRVYWMESESGLLKSALYNGSDIRIVVNTRYQRFNHKIDIGGDYIFYTQKHKIIKIHKSSGQIPSDVYTAKTDIYGLLFYKQEGECWEIMFDSKLFTTRRQGIDNHVTKKNIKDILTKDEGIFRKQ